MIEPDDIREALDDYANFIKVQPVAMLNELAEAVRAENGGASAENGGASELRKREFAAEVEVLAAAEDRLHLGSGLAPAAIEAFDEGFRELGIIQLNQAALVGLIVGARALRRSEERSR